jgi:hypothetical protein
MSNGVGLVLLAIGFGVLAVAFQKYGVDVAVMAWTLMVVGAGGLVLRLVQPMTRWSLHRRGPNAGRRDTA